MMKERMMAILIGGLMLFSVAGFALMGMGRFIDDGNQPAQVPNIMNEYLTGEQVSSILRSGRVLIRDVYTRDCTDCMSKDVTLEIFVNSFPGLVVLEKAMIEPGNTTVVDEMGYVKFEMLSPTGEIVELGDKNITHEDLTVLFCEVSAIQPKECLLRDIANQQPLDEPEINDTVDNVINQTDMNGNDANITSDDYMDMNGTVNDTTDNSTINSSLS